MDAEALVVEALTQLGLTARLDSSTGSRVDLIVGTDDVAMPIEVKSRSLVTKEVAERLMGDDTHGGPTVLVVGDRVTEEARTFLVQRGAGYYDLRGRLVLRGSRIVIDAEVVPVVERRARTAALAGKVGLEVATALLRQPHRGVAVRELARRLGRSASTVSEVLAVLRRDGLVDAGNSVVGDQLFWQVAERWRTAPTYLEHPPSRTDTALVEPLRLGLTDIEQEAGWALTDSMAAVAYGAPAAVRSGQLVTFYVPDALVVRRATTLLGAAGSMSSASCAVKVAPVPAVCDERVDVRSTATDWPLAHPVFVALDLAQDVGRGREILDAWTPDDRWARVW